MTLIYIFRKCKFAFCFLKHIYITPHKNLDAKINLPILKTECLYNIDCLSRKYLYFPGTHESYYD